LNSRKDNWWFFWTTYTFYATYFLWFRETIVSKKKANVLSKQNKCNGLWKKGDNKV